MVYMDSKDLKIIALQERLKDLFVESEARILDLRVALTEVTGQIEECNQETVTVTEDHVSQED